MRPFDGNRLALFYMELNHREFLSKAKSSVTLRPIRESNGGPRGPQPHLQPLDQRGRQDQVTFDVVYINYIIKSKLLLTFRNREVFIIINYEYTLNKGIFFSRISNGK